MFEHLTDITSEDFIELADMDTPTLLSAQATTAGTLLEQLGSPEYILAQDSASTARDAFAAVTNPDMPPALKKDSLLALRTPAAVKHLAGMLSQYDWDFIEQAKELRGYVVAKLLEETTHADARIRLGALKMVGSLTEVASFTERSVVTHVQEAASDIEERLRARLKSLLPPVMEVQDVEVQEIAVVKKAPKAE